ncbi:MAG: SusC/RagA family TonB-linked outer membrane protein [Bacteroidales bacterium]|jgi:TonB-linked SusC/RagA family outer membrane protein|nr:SusC/RagA family TonB-linked outer membrane protein [Bacteroidales bacterium]
MKKILMVIGMICVGWGNLSAQTVQVTGTVTDENGDLLPDASVRVKGSTAGTTTDSIGKYTITVAGDAVLIFSFVGMVTQEIETGGRSTIDVSLQTGLQMDEVVVTAPGISQEKEAPGYAVQEVKSAQTVQVTGTVTEESGDLLPGASVRVKGSTAGTTTDSNGKYTITVAGDAVLIFSFVGMVTQEIETGGRSTIDVSLQTGLRMDEVVVTALGISREKKALGYAVQEVKADQLTQAANPSLATALQGKTSGLSIRPSSGMPGASSQITIRGARSFDGNNTPLYVIDGMPVASTYDISTIDGITGTDFSNRAIDFDPNDIESVNILKGQAASALYGLRASNGVIVITTKSGKGLAKGKAHVTFNSSVGFDVISRYPELQTKYAQGSGGIYFPQTSYSWGPLITELPDSPSYGGNTVNSHTGRDGMKPGMYYVPQRANAGLDPWVTPQVYNNVKEYFERGLMWNNFINVAQSLESSSYSVSLGSSTQTGIVPSTGMDRYNAKVNAETQLSRNWKSGITSSYVSTSVSKMPSANDGIMAQVYPAPSSYNLAGIPCYYENNPTRPNNYRAGSFPNPYWAIDNLDFTEKTDRFYGSAFIEFSADLSDHQVLKVKYQPGVDFYTSNYEDMWGYGIKGSNSNGQVENYNISNMTFNSWLTLNYDWRINETWRLDAMLGNEILQNNSHYVYAYGAGFQFPGWNHINNSISKNTDRYYVKDRTAGFFGSFSLSYGNMLFLTATGREDIVSAMPRNNRSYFYPSLSLGFILTELDALNHNPVLDYAKLRASYAEVGQAGDGTNAYKTNFYSVPEYGGGFYAITPLMYPVNGTNAYAPSWRIYDPRLTPQNTISFELGFDAGLWDNTVRLNYTFSRQNVKDQIFGVPLAGSTGAAEYVTNAGKLHTNTHEITLGLNPVRTKFLHWELAFNFTKMSNRVDELAEGVESIMLGGFTTPQVRAGVQDEYPVIYGTSYRRNDQGRITVDDYGVPMAGEPRVIGQVAPDFLLGFNTTLRIYKLTVSAVLDWKSGGQIYGGTNGLLDYYGVSKKTEDRGEGSFIFDGDKEDGTKNDVAIKGATEWEIFFQAVNDNIDESSIYNNSFIKLREIALSCPIVNKDHFQASLNVFARNLLLWTNFPNFDPEATQGNTNMTGAFERFSLPQTSSYGLGLTIKF